MKKSIIKLVMSIIGISIFILGIITSIDGIGRFAIILFGTVFSLTGSLIQFDSKDK